MKRTALVLAFLAPLVLLFVAFRGQLATATPDAHKWYVCKYVGTPGDFETLQTGENPIFVDDTAIETYPNVAVGDDFVDAQGHSLVVAGPYAPPGIDPEPSCPTSSPTPTETSPPPTSSSPTPTTSPSCTDGDHDCEPCPDPDLKAPSSDEGDDCSPTPTTTTPPPTSSSPPPCGTPGGPTCSPTSPPPTSSSPPPCQGPTGSPSPCPTQTTPPPPPPPSSPPPSSPPPSSPPPSSPPPTSPPAPPTWSPTWSPTWTPTHQPPSSPPPTTAFTGAELGHAPAALLAFLLIGLTSFTAGVRRLGRREG